MPALRSLAALVASVTAVAVVVHSGVFDDVSVPGLRARIDAFGSLAPLVFVVTGTVLGRRVFGDDGAQ